MEETKNLRKRMEEELENMTAALEAMQKKEGANKSSK